MVTNVVARDGETATSWHSPPLLFVLATLTFYNGWEDHKTYTHTLTPDKPSTSCKDFVNVNALNH